MANPKTNLRLLASDLHGGRAEKPASDAPEAKQRWLSVSEVSRLLQVPDRRLRRYLDRHPGHAQTRRTGRKHLIASDSVPALARIRDLYAEGATARDVDATLANPRISSTPADTSHSETRALAGAMVTAAAAGQITDLHQQVADLRDKVHELCGDIEQRDRVLRRALMAIVDLFQYNENERQIAERERDRDTAHDRQRVMLALQELLVYQRKRRRWF